MTSSVDPSPIPSYAAGPASDARAGRLREAITNPGAVKINVKGAFIVDDEPRSKSPGSPGNAEGAHYDSKDIRLPHHKGVVSHVAVDVSAGVTPLCPSPTSRQYFLRSQDGD